MIEIFIQKLSFVSQKGAAFREHEQDVYPACSTRKNGVNGAVWGNSDRLRFFFLCQFDFQFAANGFGVFPQRSNRVGMLAAGFQSGDGTF